MLSKVNLIKQKMPRILNPRHFLFNVFSILNLLFAPLHNQLIQQYLFLKVA